MVEPVSIVIPSYNGKQMLDLYFKSVIDALDEYPGGGEIIVVDDGGADGTAGWIKNNYPDVKTVELHTNMGFACAANRGVESARYGSVILLNNDMKPRSGFISHLVDTLQSSENVFAVSARSIVKDGTDEAANKIVLDDGILKVAQPGLGVTDLPFENVVTIGFAPGGVSIFRRDRFIKLGGFDAIYKPFYWEDVDLSWRAWASGWSVLYEPRSAVEHLSHGTIGDLYMRAQYDLVYYANMHIFNMRFLKNHELDKYLLRVNRLQTEINLFDQGVIRRAFFIALSKLDEIMERRRAVSMPVLSTEEILKSCSNLSIVGENL